MSKSANSNISYNVKQTVQLMHLSHSVFSNWTIDTINICNQLYIHVVHCITACMVQESYFKFYNNYTITILGNQLCFCFRLYHICRCDLHPILYT